MSERFELPDDDTLAVAERAFDVLATEAALGVPIDGMEFGEHVTLRRLYVYVTEARPKDPDLETALRESSALRAELRRLTEKIACYHIPELAAAAAGGVAQRVAPGCRIRFEESRAEPAQTYIIISLDDPGRHPRWLAVFVGDNTCRQVALPEPHAGLIQILVENDSEVLAALRDPGSEIFIDG